MKFGPARGARFGAVQVTGTLVFPVARVMEQARWDRGEQFTSRRLQDGLSRLQDLYRDENYLEASIQIVRRTFHAETNRVDLEVEVVAGPRIEISVSGGEFRPARTWSG